MGIREDQPGWVEYLSRALPIGTEWIDWEQEWLLTWRDGRIGVHRVSRRTGRHFWGRESRPHISVTDALLGRRTMASKWIEAATKGVAKATRIAEGNDPYLFKDRPALLDFMTELEGGSGKPRDPSVLMIAVSLEGVRVGLKDDDAGGWLWRSADTLSKALNLIEKAIQDGTAKFTSGQNRGKRK